MLCHKMFDLSVSCDLENKGFIEVCVQDVFTGVELIGETILVFMVTTKELT